MIRVSEKRNLTSRFFTIRIPSSPVTKKERFITGTRRYVDETLMKRRKTNCPLWITDLQLPLEGNLFYYMSRVYVNQIINNGKAFLGNY